MKKTFAFLTCLIMIFCCGCSRLAILPGQDAKLQPKYTEACDLLKAGNYEQAYTLFYQLGDYKDSAEHLKHFAWLPVQITQEDDGMTKEIILYTTTYSYNEHGECTSRIGTYESDIGPGYSEYNTYDALGKLIKSESTSEAGFSTITYQYDANDNLIKQVGCTEGPDVGGITTYTYNEQNLRQSSEYSSYLGIDTYSYESQEPYHTDVSEYYYDENNRCNKMIQHYGDDYQYTYTVEYNDNSLPLKVVSDDGQGNVLSTLLKYDDIGRCIEITTNYDRTVYSYGEGELPVCAVRTRDGGEPCDITYSYKLFYLRNEKDPIPFHVKEHLYFLEW